MKKLMLVLAMVVSLVMGRVGVSIAKDIPVSNFKIVEFHYDYRYNDQLFVIGEVKNVGSISAGVEIQMIGRDDSGRLVESHTFWPASIRNIPPGSSVGIERPVESKKTRKVTLQIVRARIWR